MAEWGWNLPGAGQGSEEAPPPAGTEPEGIEPLPPLPEAPRALPDFVGVPSVPPTLIADLGQVVEMTAEEPGGDPEAIEAGLPPAPPSSISQPPAPSRLSPARPVPEPVAWDVSVPPLPPPPAQSALSPVPGTVDAGTGPPEEVAQLPPLTLPPVLDMEPEEADLDVLPRQLSAPRPPPLPVDEEFYDAIAIERAEVRSLPPEPPPEPPPDQPPPSRSWSAPPSRGEVRFSLAPTDRVAPPPEELPGERTPVPGEELPALILMEAELPPSAQSPVEPLDRLRHEAPTAPPRAGVGPAVPLPSSEEPIARPPAPPGETRASAVRLLARRIPLPDVSRLPPPPRPAGVVAPIAAEERRRLVALLDAEVRARPEGDPQRAHLATASAWQLQLLGEAGEAHERYRLALELDPQHRPTLRGLRRLLSQPGPASQPEEALALIERELEGAAAGEAAFLSLLRAELLLLLGEAGAARVALGAARLADPSASAAALAAEHDAALHEGVYPQAAAAVGALAGLVLPHRPALTAALHVERARLLEQAGQDSEAAAAFAAALDLHPGVRLPAGWGLLRCALRLPEPERQPWLRQAHQALGEALPPSPLRSALVRRAARLDELDADRIARLREAAAQGDRWALDDLGRALERTGQHGEAARCYAELAACSTDPVRRADALLRAGEALERAGRLEQARATLLEALRRAETAGLDHDAVAERALERVELASGRPEELLALVRRKIRRRSSAFAPALHLQAARILLAQGDRSQAQAELTEALRLQPDYGPALMLLRQLLVEDGRFEEAAEVLRAALHQEPGPSQGDAAQRLLYREDAARLLGRAGRPAEGALLLAADLRQVQAPATVRALRWHVQRLLGPRVELVPETEPELTRLLVEVMRAEAEEAAADDRLRAADLWFRQGLLLEPAYPLVTPEGSLVEESLARALALEPAHGPALVTLCGRALSAGMADAEVPLAGSRLVQLLLEHYRERLLSATGRPEAAVLLLRLAALQEHEAQDPRGALLTLNLLRSVAPAHPGASDIDEGLLHLSRRAGDPERTLELLQDELAHEHDEDLRFALHVQIGELYESLGQTGAAASQFEQALELRRGHPVARAALWRLYQAGGEHRKLRQLAETELREAVDFAGRVAARERLAALATLDPELAQDPAHAIEAYQELLAVDANHHLAMRVLERHFIAEQNWGDLIHLYEQMGLTATDTAFAVHIHLERAHLRQRLAWQSNDSEPPAQLINELENDFRLALYRDQHSRPALRHILALALRTEDLAQMADLSVRLAEICDQSGRGRGEAGDGRAAAVFLTRAAECYAALGQPAELVLHTYREAIARNPRHVPAVRGLLHFCLLHRHWSEAADAAELCAETLYDPQLRYEYHLLAGALCQERLGDVQRALANYREALGVDPARPEAFERMRAILMGKGGGTPDPVALAELIAEQIDRQVDPQRQVALRLDLAELLCHPLGNRARAKVELRQALAVDARSARALAMLARLHLEDGEWVEAVDLLVRRARIERDPSELADIFLQLGRIYSEHLPDPRRAMASYSKVLELVPDHVGALAQLSALYLQQQRPDAAVPLLERLSALVPEREQKVAYLHRAARILESTGEVAAAQQMLQRAVDVDPLYLPAIGALAHFFDRQSDVRSMRVHLDLAAQRFRQLLRDNPLNVDAYLGLVQIYVWRRAIDLAGQTAAVVVALGGTLPPEIAPLLEREHQSDHYPGEALRDPQLDDLLFPPTIPSGFRNLFQLAHEPLSKIYRADWKQLEQLGVQRRERLPRSGHPVRELANRLAADLGAGDFEIYATASLGRDEQGRPAPLCQVEPTEPPSLVVSQVLLAGAAEAELRFVLGRLLKLVQARMVLPLALSADELSLLLGGLVRLFVKDYVPLGYAEKRVEAEAQRLHRHISRKLEAQLLPFAMECSSAALDAARIRAALIPCADRAGLLIAGSIGPALAALRRMGPAAEPQLMDLLQFAVSMEYGEMRRLLGISRT
ncbi:MAG: tetratricopeptide repeat protein [Myxococcales bacterium]|nr:tetratricopeptide repeat protein [Myxococcales bacterium]